MTIWRHSLIRRCLLSHPHLLHHPIDLITRPIYSLIPKNDLDHIVCSTASIANEGWEGVGVLIEFYLHVGEWGWNESLLCICHTLL